MAESISEGTLATIHKQAGEKVEIDEELASIETDKIDVAVNAPQAGQIIELLVSEGDQVEVGQDVAVLETEPDTTQNTLESNDSQSSQQETPLKEATEGSTSPASNTVGPLFAKQAEQQSKTPNANDLKPGERVVSPDAKPARCVCSKSTGQDVSHENDNRQESQRGSARMCIHHNLSGDRHVKLAQVAR